MTWGSIGAAAVGLVGGALSGGSSQGGTATQTKDPWAAAVPWLTSNLGIGQNLQQQYAAQPFNPLQQGAYGNLFAGNDYVNQMIPGLLGQMSQQTGYDRNNPGRAAPFQFPAMQPQNFQPMRGLLAPSLSGAMGMGAASTAAGAPPAPPAAQPGPVGGSGWSPQGGNSGFFGY